MTNDELIQSLNDAFTTAGIDTPEKIGAFVSIAALQVRLNSQNFQLQRIDAERTASNEAITKKREDQLAAIQATQSELLAIISAQA